MNKIINKLKVKQMNACPPSVTTHAQSTFEWAILFHSLRSLTREMGPVLLTEKRMLRESKYLARVAQPVSELLSQSTRHQSHNPYTAGAMDIVNNTVQRLAVLQGGEDQGVSHRRFLAELEACWGR